VTAAACLSLRQPKADSASCCLTALRTRPPSTTLHATLQTDLAQSTSQQSRTCCGLRAGRPRSLCAQLRCIVCSRRCASRVFVTECTQTYTAVSRRCGSLARDLRAQRPAARTAARSLVRVGVRIIGLHVAAICKLLKLLLYVPGRLPHRAAVGGDDGSASRPAGGVLFLRQAAVSRGCDALWLLDARSRAGG
jgi:hypothetical protein